MSTEHVELRTDCSVRGVVVEIREHGIDLGDRPGRPARRTVDRRHRITEAADEDERQRMVQRSRGICRFDVSEHLEPLDEPADPTAVGGRENWPSDQIDRLVDGADRPEQGDPGDHETVSAPILGHR